MFRDRILWLLVGLWLASVAAFVFDVLPYPIGFIILSILIIARLLDLKIGKR